MQPVLFISICCYNLETINLIVLFISIVFHFHTVSENNVIILSMCLLYSAYRQLRTRRALMQLKDVPLRTRRALLPLTLYSNSALLVLMEHFWAAITPFWLSTDDIEIVKAICTIDIKSSFFSIWICLEILILLLFIQLQLKPHILLLHNILYNA